MGIGSATQLPLLSDLIRQPFRLLNGLEPAGTLERAFPLCAVEPEDPFHLQIALDPLDDLGLDLGTLACGGVRLGTEIDPGERYPLGIHEIGQGHAQHLGEGDQDARARQHLTSLVLADGLCGDLSAEGFGEPAQGQTGLLAGQLEAITEHRLDL